MGFTYLNGKNWAQVTRDERYFCAELFFAIKNDIPKFLAFLNECNICRFSDEEIQSEWEVGYEVCFYRDYITEFAKDQKGKLLKSPVSGDNVFSAKRTFDLVLFNESHLIIIEAKCFGGFTNDQLNDFKKDIQQIKDLLKDVSPNVIILALHSSALKKFRQTTKDVFEGKMFTWLDVTRIYPTNNVFKRANRNIDC